MAARAPRKVAGRRRAASARRGTVPKRQAKSQGRSAVRDRKTAKRASRGGAKPRLTKQQKAQQRAISALFHDQIDALWTRFGNECRQFVDGFNAEMGSSELKIETGADFVLTRCANGGEALVQLVPQNQHMFCVLTTGCNDLGACAVDQLPIGFSIIEGQLGFMHGVEPKSEAELAVKLLTELVSMNTPASDSDRSQSA